MSGLLVRLYWLVFPLYTKLGTRLHLPMPRQLKTIEGGLFAFGGLSRH